MILLDGERQRAVEIGIAKQNPRKRGSLMTPNCKPLCCFQQVAQPSWLNDRDGGYSVFEGTKALFDKYMKEGKTYEAWQMAHGMMQAIDFGTGMSWMTRDQVKSVGYGHFFSTTFFVVLLCSFFSFCIFLFFLNSASFLRLICIILTF